MLLLMVGLPQASLENSVRGQARDFLLGHAADLAEDIVGVFTDARAAARRRSRSAIENRACPFDFHLADYRIIDLHEMSDMTQVVVAREIKATADDVRRNSRGLQLGLDRIALARMSPLCDRAIQIVAIAEPSNNRVEARVAERTAQQVAQCGPSVRRRRVDRNPSILARAGIHAL